MDDAPTKFGDYAPRDFDGGFQGAVTARDALRMSLNVPAVMVLDRVGPLRFTLALAECGRASGFPDARRDAEPAGGARRARHLARRHHDALCRHRRRRHRRERLRFIADAPDAPKHRLFGPVAAYYLRDILDGVALPEGWAMGQGLPRAAPSPSRPARPTASAMRGRWASPTTTPSACGWAAPTARRAPAASGARTRAPILLKTFDLLPPDKRARAARARRRDHGADRPSNCRRSCASSPARPRRRRRSPPTCRRPRSPFRPTARRCRCPRPNAKDKTIMLKADGGARAADLAGQRRSSSAASTASSPRSTRPPAKASRASRWSMPGPQRQLRSALQACIRERGVTAAADC